MTTLLASEARGAETTSTTSPELVEKAEPLTMGVADEPAVVQGIQPPCPGWSTLPRATVQEPCSTRSRSASE